MSPKTYPRTDSCGDFIPRSPIACSFIHSPSRSDRAASDLTSPSGSESDPIRGGGEDGARRDGTEERGDHEPWTDEPWEVVFLERRGGCVMLFSLESWEEEDRSH